MLKWGDEISIDMGLEERGILGSFRNQDEDYIAVKGTVGDDIGKLILVPKKRIFKITVIKKKVWEE